MPFSQQVYLTISSIPFFVWPLFALLLFVGFRASHSRSMPVVAFYALPLIGLTVLPTLFRIGLSPQTFAAFGAFYMVGAVIGYKIQERLIENVDLSRVVIKGELVTMMTVMAMFFSNFVFGTITAVAPGLASGLLFKIVFLGAIGFCAGVFFGRSTQVIKQSRQLVIKQ